MTIDEAIKLNEDTLSLLRLFASPERVEAMRVGLEALKRLTEDRIAYDEYAMKLLPGETEE